MAARSSDLETVRLILRILQILPKNRKTTIEEIRKSLADIGIERSTRTLQRIMNDTVCSEFDVELDDRSKPYGYSWKKHSEGLSISVLNEQQALLLMLAKSHLNALLPASVTDYLEPFFKQAQRQLQQESGQNTKQWLNKAAIVPSAQPLLPPKIAEGVYEAVSEALFHNRKLRLQYRNQNGYGYSQTVCPIALAQQGSALYLVAQFDGYDDFRHLALHRIQKAEVSTFGFEPPEDFNFGQYISDGRFGFADGQKICLRFSVTKEAGFHLTEMPLSADQQIIEESAEHYRFQATLVDSAMLEWWLRKFGGDIWDIEKTPVSVSEKELGCQTR